MSQSTKQTDKPLYKVLNDQRTQGEWILERKSSWNQIGDDKVIIRSEIPSNNLWERVAEFDLTTLTGRTNLLGGSYKADAAYTIIAVNNLHHLAEALEKISVMKLNTGEKLDWKDAAEAIDIAKEALARIS